MNALAESNQFPMWGPGNQFIATFRDSIDISQKLSPNVRNNNSNVSTFPTKNSL